ncbi:ABC transporter permease [Micromonospora fluostatini]
MSTLRAGHPRLQELAALTRRWYLQLVRDRLNLGLTLLQPAFWLVFFGGAVRRMVDDRITGTPDYVSFLLPGVVAFTAIGTSISGAVPLLWDKETGYLDKLMSMPIARASLLGSRLAFQAAVTVAQVAVILLVAAAMGVRVRTGVVGVLVVLAVTAVLAVALSAVFLALAFHGPGHTTFFAVTGFVTLPLLFTSNAFVPVEAMPTWMALVARANPLTYAIEAMRLLVTSGWGVPVVAHLVGLVGFTALCVLLTYHRFRTYTSAR